MQNKHILNIDVNLKCTKESCGYTFTRKVKIEYTTNQRGDIIESKVIRS